jgi:hypothetical protein
MPGNGVAVTAVEARRRCSVFCRCEKPGKRFLERVLFFLPPFPESIDSLALFSLLLVVGLLIGEWLHARSAGRR